jgi:hypothetical protein
MVVLTREFTMECDRCGTSMKAEECRELGGKKLCEDYFLDASEMRHLELLREHQQRSQVFIALF